MQRVMLIILALVMLSGCASTIKSTRMVVGSELPQEHGVVAVKVVSNTNQLAPLHPRWTEVIAFRLDNAEQLKQAAIDKAKAHAKSKGRNFYEDKVEWKHDIYSLRALSEGVIDSQVFVGSMPAGEYIIGSLHSFYTDGNMSSWITMPVNISAGKFNVKQNNLSDLGTVVFQPLLSIKEPSFWNNRSEQKAYVTRMPSKKSLQSFVTTHYPKLAKKLDLSSIITWQQDDLGDFRSQLSQLSRENAYADQTAHISGGLSKALLAKFGQLKLLDENQQWEHHDVPTNSRLSSALRIDDMLIVGSELGAIFIKNDSSKHWQELSPISAKEAVMWFGKIGNSIYALTSSRQNYFVYDVKDIRTNWQKVGTFKRKERSGFFVQNGGLYPVVTGNNVLRIINDNEKFDFDTITNTWKKSKSESLASMLQLKDGTLVGLEVSQWDGIGKQTVSFDDGDTWLSLSRKLKTWGDRKPDASLPVVLDGNTIVSLGRSRDKSNKDLILISKDKTKTNKKYYWKEHGKVKEGCYSMLPNLSQGSMLFFLCDQGEIVSTNDLGKTWKLELDINIAEMQKEYEALLAALKEQEKEKEKEKKQEQSGSEA
ncbi:hypothetical protein [Psychrobium sp. 1_MG-2023]|uniref:hypothetical protein n=1 Tax=Psychrobium sp. 1_MG-2023 TaxID=3062624 RepID=UPI000C320759|nr:hypothetical protein [Psychrobium sp. 1_MG-2023]MDP2561361.1 hypothetical protein [Psychrobium sp. 1_MG-2023]PKF54842.1 hypothetical protein CW748_14945 [Alteromonadales bacterium alter-6D02]